MTDLREIGQEPSFLAQFGFERRDEITTNPDRYVWYEKTFKRYTSQLCLVVQVEFELFISDDPEASYTENLSYSFNRVFLRVIDRQMVADGSEGDELWYDEETEFLREIDRWRLPIQTVEQLNAFCELID